MKYKKLKHILEALQLPSVEQEAKFPASFHHIYAIIVFVALRYPNSTVIFNFI